jgi:hypothetical protein
MLGRTNTGGGGGGGLNFKVICNPQPSTAKENTIWIDTDRINNYYFAATQPENMAEYDVWFPIGTYSSVAFSATKKNPIMVYPLSAKQYISGAWVDKTAKSYQNNEWADWIRPIDVALTSDVWTHKSSGKDGYTSGSIKYADGTIQLSLTKATSSYGAGSWCYKYEDFTNVTEVEFELSLSSAAVTTAYVGVVANKPTTTPKSWVAFGDVNRITDTQTVKVNLLESGITTGYICIQLENLPSGTTSNCTATITSIKKWSSG